MSERLGKNSTKRSLTPDYFLNKIRSNDNIEEGKIMIRNKNNKDNKS